MPPNPYCPFLTELKNGLHESHVMNYFRLYYYWYNLCLDKIFSLFSPSPAFATGTQHNMFMVSKLCPLRQFISRNCCFVEQTIENMLPRQLQSYFLSPRSTYLSYAPTWYAFLKSEFPSLSTIWLRKTLPYVAFEPCIGWNQSKKSQENNAFSGKLHVIYNNVYPVIQIIDSNRYCP